MKTRATLALAVVAGLPAAVSAQETFLVHYSWFTVNANTNVASSIGAASVVDPGEGARIRVGVTALINGTNAVGQTSNYTTPTPAGIGTIKGLGSAVYDLVGDGAAATANGNWTQRSGPSSPLDFGGTAGTIQGAGAAVHGAGGAQVVTPPVAGAPQSGTANPLNADVRITQASWTPADYTARTVNWLARASVLVPTGQGNSVLLAYGTATQEDNNFNVYTYDLLVGKYFGSSFGQGLNIPIAPAPSSLALLGLGALVAGGRRRS